MTLHPNQEIIKDSDGRPRFRANEIVRFLLDNGGYDMNKLASINFSDEDRMQFAQLIGYGLNGYSELSYVSDASWDRVVVADPTGTFRPDAQDSQGPKAMTPTLTDSDREAIAAAMRECAAQHPATHKEGYAAACTACYLAGLAAGMEREREQIIGVIRQYLLHNSQRAVSWHEVQDCIVAIREQAKGD